LKDNFIHKGGRKYEMIKIAFAGNPNVGKSALINAIAGSKLKVGNWPGVTVEKKEAEFEHDGQKIQMIDLPGVYSLSPYTLEEKITREYILNENPDVVINVVDSTNLERNLYLTLLLKELGKPMIMALNFLDEFENLNYKLDLKKFQEHLEMEAIHTSAIKNKGIKELLEKALVAAAKHKEQMHTKYELRFDNYIEKEIRNTRCKVKSDERFIPVLKKYAEDFVCIKLLEQDSYFGEILKNEYEIDIYSISKENVERIEEKFDEDVETVFAEGRYGALKGILAQTFTTSLKSRLDFTDKVDRILLNKYLGLPIFFLIISGIMGVVFNGSGPYIDWVDGFIGDYIGKYVAMGVEGTPDWLYSLVTDGIIGGVGGVLVFVPLMLFLYFFLALLEESGYMSRVAFLMDKIMRKLGLNGKAFVPMVLGFGCTVPAIYATRTLEDEPSRRLTALMAPFMSCGARLPVYGLFTAAFFGVHAGLIVMSLYVLGIIIAVLTGMIFKNNPNFKATDKALLLELPPYRIPSFKMIWSSTITRTGSYLKKATTVILGILILLWALIYFPNGGDASNSYMAKFGKVIAPIMKPTGFGNRWEAVAAIAPSIAAKEVVVGFMAQVLPKEEVAGASVMGESVEEPTTFGEDTLDQIKGFAVATKDSALSMLSFDIGSLFSPPSADEVEEEGTGIVSATSKLWEGDPLGPLRAYSFMVFILLVVPCVVTLAAIKQEFGVRFMWFTILVMTIVPYIASTVIFQVGRLFI
jgi:ferrous iron transport protein B